MMLSRDITRHGIKKILRVAVFAIISIIVLGYALFAFHDFIIGPSIVIIEPANGSTLSNPRVTVVGVVKRIQDISLNDRPITIDDKGNFKEIELLAPGYNVFTLKAQDKFGRNAEYRLELIYKVN